AEADMGPVFLKEAIQIPSADTNYFCSLARDVKSGQGKGLYVERNNASGRCASPGPGFVFALCGNYCGFLPVADPPQPEQAKAVAADAHESKAGRQGYDNGRDPRHNSFAERRRDSVACAA